MKETERITQTLMTQNAGADIASGRNIDGLNTGTIVDLDTRLKIWQEDETQRPFLPKTQIMVNGFLTPLEELRRMCCVSGMTTKIAYLDRDSEPTCIDPWHPYVAPEALRIIEQNSVLNREP